MDKFNVITTKSGEGIISINDTSLSPYLEYTKEGQHWTIDNLTDNKGRAKFDDLASTLYYRSWLIGPRYLIDEDKLYLAPDNYDTDIPEIKKEDTKMISEFAALGDADKFNKIYMKLLNMGNTEIELENKYFNYLVSTRNLLEGSSVVDLLSYPVDYTSIINLNELLQKRDKIRYYKADYTIKVGIIYVKSGGRIAENITFTPFYFDKDGNLLDKSFQMTINDEVEVEYADGCIRLFPLIPDITECIIQHCFVVCDGLL